MDDETQEEGQTHAIGVTLPSKSMLTGSILVVAYIDEDGTEKWDVRLGCTMNQSQVLGLLELAKFNMLAR